MPRLEPKHPLAIRLTHWLNVPVLAVMIWSGVAISGAKAPRRVGYGNWTLVEVFPQAFFDQLDMPGLDVAMGWHFTFAPVFAINGLIYVISVLLTGSWRSLLPNRKSLGEGWRVFLRDLGLKADPPPRRKYNGAQQIAYCLAIAMGAVLLASGLAIYRPIQLAWLVRIFGGYQPARSWHFWLTIAISAFVFIHILQVMRAGWNTFRAMIIGKEFVSDKEPSCELSWPKRRN